MLSRRCDALRQAKLEPRWDRGVWLGRSAISGEHILYTSEGVMLCRSVRGMPLTEQFNSTLITSMNIRPEETLRNEVPEEDVPALPLPADTRSVQERGGALTRQGKALRDFKAWQGGDTPGCSSCKYGSYGRTHSVDCRRRRQQYEAYLRDRDPTSSTTTQSTATAMGQQLATPMQTDQDQIGQDVPLEADQDMTLTSNSSTSISHKSSQRNVNNKMSQRRRQLTSIFGFVTGRRRTSLGL